jgi:hypothetical protein
LDAQVAVPEHRFAEAGNDLVPRRRYFSTPRCLRAVFFNCEVGMRIVIASVVLFLLSLLVLRTRAAWMTPPNDRAPTEHE